MPVVERVWTWRFPLPPETLWPYLVDTGRINEASWGCCVYATVDTTLPDGTVRRTGATKRLGVSLTWDEGVPEWIANRSYKHRRTFHRGPIRWLEAAIALEPQLDGATAVRFRLRIDAAGWAAAAVRFGVRRRFGPRLDSLYRSAAEFAAAGTVADYASGPPSVSATARQRVADQARSLGEQGYGAAEQLAEHLLTARDLDLERMRPRALARRWGTEPRAAIETCLAAARSGLLQLRWDLLCPRCRGAKVVESRASIGCRKGPALPELQHRLRARFHPQCRGDVRARGGYPHARDRRVLPIERAR